MSHPFTVLLLRPDYRADVFGQDTYCTFITIDEDDPHKAILAAQLEASVQDGAKGADELQDEHEEHEELEDPDDYFPLFVCRGHVPNLAGG